MFFSKSEKKKRMDIKPGDQLTEKEITEILRPIRDPDIGISIIELGLIYRIVNTSGDIDIDMTFTTPACPYGPQLMEEVKYTLSSIDGIKTVTVNIVWDPPWSMDNLSEETKLELGIDL